MLSQDVYDRRVRQGFLEKKCASRIDKQGRLPRILLVTNNGVGVRVYKRRQASLKNRIGI